eukprot:Rmarinus@m.12732
MPSVSKQFSGRLRTFHSAAVTDFAKALSSSNASWEQVEKLVALCPPPPTDEGFSSKPSKVLDIRCLEVLEAIGLYIVLSGGQHWEALLDRLTAYLDALPLLRPRSPKQPTSVPIEVFVLTLGRILLSIAASVEAARQSVVDAIVGCLVGYHSLVVDFAKSGEEGESISGSPRPESTAPPSAADGVSDDGGGDDQSSRASRRLSGTARVLWTNSTPASAQSQRLAATPEEIETLKEAIAAAAGVMGLLEAVSFPVPSDDANDCPYTCFPFSTWAAAFSPISACQCPGVSPSIPLSADKRASPPSSTRDYISGSGAGTGATAAAKQHLPSCQHASAALFGKPLYLFSPRHATQLRSVTQSVLDVDGPYSLLARQWDGCPNESLDDTDYVGVQNQADAYDHIERVKLYALRVSLRSIGWATVTSDLEKEHATFLFDVAARSLEAILAEPAFDDPFIMEELETLAHVTTRVVSYNAKYAMDAANVYRKLLRPGTVEVLREATGSNAFMCERFYCSVLRQAPTIARADENCSHSVLEATLNFMLDLPEWLVPFWAEGRARTSVGLGKGLSAAQSIVPRPEADVECEVEPSPPAIVLDGLDALCGLLREARRRDAHGGSHAFSSQLSIVANFVELADDVSVGSSSFSSLCKVWVLGRLGQELPAESEGASSQSVSLVLPRMFDLVYRPLPARVQTAIIAALTEIAIHHQEYPQICEDIVTLLAGRYLSSVEEDEAPNLSKSKSTGAQAIPRAFERLALGIHNRRARMMLRRRLLALFAEVGTAIHRRCVRQRHLKPSALGHSLGTLLASLSFALQPSPPRSVSALGSRVHLRPPGEGTTAGDYAFASSSSSYDEAKQFRAAWLYVVAHNFTKEEVWPKAWREAAQRIASNSPPIVARPESQHHIQTELEVKALLEKGLPEQTEAEFRTTMSALVPECAITLGRCTFAQCAYLLCIYNMHRLQASRCHFGACFTYLERHEGFELSGLSVSYGYGSSSGVGATGMEMRELMYAVVDKVFDTFVRALDDHPSTRVRSALLQKQIRILILKCASPLPRVRQAATKYVGELVHHFPLILWSPLCFYLLLCLTHAVAECGKNMSLDKPAVGMEFLQEGDFGEKNVEVEKAVPDSLPAGRGVLEPEPLPDGPEARAAVLASVAQTLQKWVERAANRSVAHTVNLLMYFLQANALPSTIAAFQKQLARGYKGDNSVPSEMESHQSHFAVAHVGVAIALQALISSRESSRAGGLMAECVSWMAEQCRALGHVEGMNRMAGFVKLEQPLQGYIASTLRGALLKREDSCVVPVGDSAHGSHARVRSDTINFMNSDSRLRSSPTSPCTPQIGSAARSQTPPVRMSAMSGSPLRLPRLLCEAVEAGATFLPLTAKSLHKAVDALMAEAIRRPPACPTFFDVRVSEFVPSLFAVAASVVLMPPTHPSAVAAAAPAPPYRGTHSKWDAGQLAGKPDASVCAVDVDLAVQDALRWIVWVPNILCTRLAMEAGIGVWRWILAARPDMELHFFAELEAAWRWAIEHRLGLFSGESDDEVAPHSSDRTAPPEESTQGSPAASGSSAAATPQVRSRSLSASPPEKKTDTAEAVASVALEQLSAHDLLISFLSERFNVIRFVGGPLLNKFRALLFAALRDARQLSTRQDGLGPRTRLLSLALKAAHLSPKHAHIHPQKVAGNGSTPAEGWGPSVLKWLLTERVYLAAFEWFVRPPRWFGQRDMRASRYSDVDADMRSINELANYVNKLRGWCEPLSWEQNGASSVVDPPKLIFDNTSTPLPVAVTLDVDVKAAVLRARLRRRSTLGTSEPTVTLGKSASKSKLDATSSTGSAGMSVATLAKRRSSTRNSLLTLLLYHEATRMAAWACPRKTTNQQLDSAVGGDYIAIDAALAAVASGTGKGAKWSQYVAAAWAVHPDIAIQLATRFQEMYPAVRSELERRVRAEPVLALHSPQAVKYLVTLPNIQSDIPELRWLHLWTCTDLPIAVSYLDQPYRSHACVSRYTIRSLQSKKDEDLIFYLPQLVQALRFDSTGEVESYLVSAALGSEILAHQMIWCLRTEEEPKDTSQMAKAAVSTATAENVLFAISTRVRQTIEAALSPVWRRRYEQEFGYFDKVNAISGVLKPLDDAGRRARIKQELMKIDVVDNLYLPTDPNKKCIGAIEDSGTPLTSAAKVPILVVFRTIDKSAPCLPGGAPVVKPQACIFKVGDDCRQDTLALQVIRQFQTVFYEAGLDIFLFPYKVIPTSPGCGIIEVVPRSKSRDQLGKITDGGLYEYFLNKYGSESTPRFQWARRNFVRSLAGYAVVSWILQVKDRHNGNILFDEDGHMVHIDFGFIFDITPGGNFGFERAAFKLTGEMVKVMGGSPDTECFHQFEDLAVRGFLAVREKMDIILPTVEPMLASGLPCFQGDTMRRLRERFCPERSPRAATEFFLGKIQQSFLTYTTAIYDGFQAWANKIEY